jgi:hypothetical protein
MDDYELDRMASDNPALTAPAAQRAPISRRRSRGRKELSTVKNESPQDVATPNELTKYDVIMSDWKHLSFILTVFRSAGAESSATSRPPGSA